MLFMPCIGTEQTLMYRIKFKVTDEFYIKLPQYCSSPKVRKEKVKGRSQQAEGIPVRATLTDIICET